MENEKYNLIIAQIEDASDSIKYDFEISKAFEQALETHKNNLSTTQENQLKWELLLFRLMTKNIFSTDGLKTERFKPMMTFTDGYIFPDPNGFPVEAFEYFLSRSQKTRKPTFKARYLDFLWEKSKLLDKYKFAEAAIEQYLLAIESYKNEDAVIERLDCLQRAAELAITFEKKKNDKPLSNDVVQKLKEQIAETEKSGKYRWLLELFEIVVAMPKFFSDEEIFKYIAIAETAAEDYHKDQNFHIQRHFLLMKTNLRKLLKSMLPTSETTEDEIGQSLLDEAEKTGNGLAKVHFLQKAIEHFRKRGEKEKVEELITQMKSAGEWAVKNEFKKLTVEVKLKEKDVKQIKDSLGEGEKVPENIGSVMTFFPHWEHAKRLTDKLSKKFVLQHLVGTTHYGEKYPLGKPQTPQEEEEDHIMQNFKLEADLANHWLTLTLMELIEKNKVSLADFQKFFLKLQLLDSDTYETVMDGVASYLNNDHLHATYILTLQLEDFLRRLLTVFGEQTTVPQDGGFREKTLGSVLTTLKPHISEPIYRYISWVMEDYRGFNLRNNVAHGFFKKKNANPRYSTAVLHIFCFLLAHLNLKVKEKEKP